MKTSRSIFGILAMVAVFALGGCSAGRQVVYRDDVYNNRKMVRQDYQSPDYYHTDDREQPAEQYSSNAYYADEYADSEYVEGYEYDNQLEYANRINRFYYSSPGVSYYDPWFDPWHGYSGFGLGFSTWGWRPGWSFSIGWGSPYYYGWRSPYYGYGYRPWGWRSPYYGYGSHWGYNSWGHPYYGYNGYAYGNGYYGSRLGSRVRPSRMADRGPSRAGYNTRVGSRVAGNGVSRGRTAGVVQRDASGRILTGRAAAGSRVGTSRTSMGSSGGSRVGATPSRTGGTTGSRVGTSRTPQRSSAPSRTPQRSSAPSRETPSRTPSRTPQRSTATPSARPSSTPTRSSTPSRSSSGGSSYTPSRSSGSSSSSGSSRSSSGGSRSSSGGSRSSSGGSRTR